MADDIDKNEGQHEDDLIKVQEKAELKQLRHRVDEYMAMIIALTSVLILWFLQYLGLY
jgi:hypothetical protein